MGFEAQLWVKACSHILDDIFIAEPSRLQRPSSF